MKNNKNIAGRVAELITPVAAGMNIFIWDVEFVREGARQVLRITIDKPEGVSIDDCELFHRAIDPLLDEADPIDIPYYLEVSSPGIERELSREEHFAACLGMEAEVRLYAPDISGRKSHTGVLAGFSDVVIVLKTAEGEIEIPRAAAARVRTVYRFGN